MERIKPMLASASTSANNKQPVNIAHLFAQGGWTVDLKLDGIRAIAYWDGEQLALVNRSGLDITAQFPEIVSAALGPDALILDGELMAASGHFQAVATRGKLTRPAQIKVAAEQSPCRFIAFDVLHIGGQSVMDQPYVERRSILDALVLPDSYGRSVTSDSLDFVQQVREAGMEGVIAKRNGSRYIPGGRTRDWIKVKNVHHITAIAVGYEPGTGSRQHFGAMLLALIDGDKIVPIGRVGSGFTDRETHRLKAKLDAGQPFPVEIELLNLTEDRGLRHPVFRGERSDVSVLDATLDQLATIPIC